VSWLGAALGAVLYAGTAHAADITAVQQCLTANAPERSSRYELSFATRDAKGRVAEQRARVYWRRFAEGERRVLLRIEAPEKVAGSALLAIVKPATLPEIYFYLPELGRSQRVHRVEQLRGFLGRSGVELGELWRVVAAAPDLAQRLVDSAGEIAGHPTWTVEADFEIPRQEGKERVVSHVDQSTCVPLRIESFDPSGAARRRLDVDPARVEAAGRRWLPRELVFTDLRSGDRSTVDVLSVEIDTEIPAGLLTRKAMAGER
jgi:hypothetical protein